MILDLQFVIGEEKTAKRNSDSPGYAIPFSKGGLKSNQFDHNSISPLTKGR